MDVAECCIGGGTKQVLVCGCGTPCASGNQPNSKLPLNKASPLSSLSPSLQSRRAYAEIRPRIKGRFVTPEVRAEA